MAKTYNTNDIATTLNVSIRTAQRYVKQLINSDNTIDEDIFNLIIERHRNDEEATDSENDLIEQFFTESEYEEFKKRLTEYPLIIRHIDTLKEQISYHKKQYEDLMVLHRELINMHQISLNNTQQRNHIEAKEKNLDK